MWDVGVLDLELFKKAVLSHTFSNVICRWHNSAGAHLWGGGWVFLQGWSRATDSMVHRLPDQTNELTVDFRNMAEQAKKTQQRLYFLSVIRKKLSKTVGVLLPILYWEHPLLLLLCVVFSSTAAQRKTLQWIIKTAQETIDCPLPSLEELYRSHCRRKAKNIKKCTWLNRSHNRSIKASSHQGIRHHLAPCVKDVQYWHTCDGVPMQLCYRLRKEGT